LRKISWLIILVGVSVWLTHRFSEVEKKITRHVASVDPYATLNQVAGVPVSAPIVDERTKLLADIHRTKACYDPEVCDFPKKDPKSYGFAVGKRLVTQLKDFADRFGTMDPEEIGSLGREFVHSDDGFVQEQALNMLHSIPPSQDNLIAITEGIENCIDPTIVDQAMKEMQRYIGSEGEPAVHTVLGKIMSTGPHYSSQTVATGILPFINDTSYSDYQRTARAMDKNTTTAQRLKSALDEYHRQKTGS
jgi:hypothetical protein